MYKAIKDKKSELTMYEAYVGETIEKKIRRIVNNNEPITDGAPLVYTDRKDGVQPAYDIRTDRFEIAVDAMDKVHKSNAAKREAKAKANETTKTDEKPTIGQQAIEGMKKEGEA